MVQIIHVVCFVYGAPPVDTLFVILDVCLQVTFWYLQWQAVAARHADTEADYFLLPKLTTNAHQRSVTMRTKKINRIIAVEVGYVTLLLYCLSGVVCQSGKLTLCINLINQLPFSLVIVRTILQPNSQTKVVVAFRRQFLPNLLLGVRAFL
jgi:hypothetical protein